MLQQAVNEQGVVSESTTSEEANINRQPTSLSIQEHNFQVAKNSLKVYTEKAKKDIELSPVRTGSWFFNLGSHMVTGEEFNERLSQIESYFIELNNLNQGLIDEFGEVYEAFEALDKDYISGIVASIKAAEKVSKDEQKDRADIKKLVKQHQDSIEVLKKFKKDIDRLNHLTDIDKAWELIEDQVKLSKELSELIDELSTTVRDQESAINKIKNEQKDEQKDRADIKKLVEQHQDSIEVLKKFKKDIDRLNHLTDIDKAWELIEDQVKISKNLSKHIDELSTTVRDQESAINKIEIEQKEKFDELLETQSLTLEKIADEQLDKVCQFLEDEKNAISEQVTVLTQKVKLSYVIAGSAVALAVVQLLLNILGVF